MSNRTLVVAELDPNDPDYGKAFALPPGQASGVAIPAFKTGPTLPTVGSTVGESFLNTASKSAFVWDGSNWQPIAPNVLVTYPDDATLLADGTQIPGTYAASELSGNLYIMSQVGWRQIGVRTYPTANALLADSPVEGTLGVALDESTFWLRSGNEWHCHTIRTLADLTAIQAWAPQDGARAYDEAADLTYEHVGGSWRPESIYQADEATLLANTGVLTGQIGVTTDTGRTFVFDGTQWQGSPIRTYATEAALLADTPADRVIAFAEDTGLIYGRINGTWRRANSPTVSVGSTKPSAPAAGDLYFDPTLHTLEVHDGTQWQEPGSSPVGTIIMFPSVTPPRGYLLCDGAAITAAQWPLLHTLVGGHLPDLRDQFVRGAANQGQINGFTKHQDTTRRPRGTAFGGTTQNRGSHTHRIKTVTDESSAGWVDGGGGGWSTTVAGNDAILPDGAHTHPFSVTSGGDAETAPKHVRLAYMIKHD